MKITKEEKSLYNFLKVVANIFSRASHRTIIFGRGNKLYFQTYGYAGMFKCDSQGMFDDYSFESYFYELKQLPNGEYVLDSYKKNDVITVHEKELIQEAIDEAICTVDFVIETNKSDEFKIAKITADTGIWLEDGQVKLFNAFPECEVFRHDQDIVIKAAGITDKDISSVTTYLIITDQITGPTEEQATQQKLIVPEPLDGAEVLLDEKELDELLEETEEVEEYDPMSD